MISDQDITKLKEVFATKEAVADLSLEVGELHDKIDALDVKMDSIESKIDGLAGMIHASLEEHGAGAAHLSRHDRQINTLATNAGVTLPD